MRDLPDIVQVINGGRRCKRQRGRIAVAGSQSHPSLAAVAPHVLPDSLSVKCGAAQPIYRSTKEFETEVSEHTASAWCGTTMTIHCPAHSTIYSSTPLSLSYRCQERKRPCTAAGVRKSATTSVMTSSARRSTCATYPISLSLTPSTLLLALSLSPPPPPNLSFTHSMRARGHNESSQPPFRGLIRTSHVGFDMDTPARASGSQPPLTGVTATLPHACARHRPIEGT